MLLDLRYRSHDLLMDDIWHIAVKSATGRNRCAFIRPFLRQCFKCMDSVTERQLIVVHRVNIESPLNY